MAKAMTKATPAKKPAASRAKSSSKAAPAARRTRADPPRIAVDPVDAITLLKTDHREVDDLYDDLRGKRASDRTAA